MNSNCDCYCSNLTSSEIAVRFKSYLQYSILKLAKTAHWGFCRIQAFGMLI